ncbi:CGNR zinc finger domain-containing protein [Gracilibacillus dipsosauri]|uniref:CGNR zinc finger domain-containing protein n=1 Tax=Gracilibacillus dipsosauri TaxID=178340 RepID=UPI002409FA29
MPYNETFPLTSNYLSLDLVNTEIVRRGIRHDLLKGNFADWFQTMLKEGNIVDEQFDKEYVISDGLHALLDLREFLREGFERIVDKGDLDDQWVSHLESLIEKAPFSYKRIKEGSLVPIPVGDSLDAIVSLVAFDALRLYSTGDLQALRRCANPDCVLLFIDKSGRRKWCSMKICGNRMKVSRHNQRNASE